MPKYDAFGREIGEDSLSGLGGGATEPVAAESQPQPQRPAIAIPQRPPRQRRRRRGLGFLVLFVLLIFVTPLVIGAIAIFNTVDHATKVVRGGIKDGLQVRPAPTAKPAAAPRGVRGRSLVRRANFAAALAKMRGSELKLTHLRLAPERIDAQLLTRGGRLRDLQIQPGGALKRFGSDSGPGFDTTSTIPFARLDPGAPQRLARRGAAKLHVPVSTLQYLVPTLFSGKVTWAAYFKHARYVVGDAAGRYQRLYP